MKIEFIFQIVGSGFAKTVLVKILAFFKWLTPWTKVMVWISNVSQKPRVEFLAWQTATSTIDRLWGFQEQESSRIQLEHMCCIPKRKLGFYSPLFASWVPQDKQLPNHDLLPGHRPKSYGANRQCVKTSGTRGQNKTFLFLSCWCS